MEIKQGDKVRVSEDAPKMYFRGWDTIFKSNDCNVLDVEDDNAAIAYGPYIKAVPTKYLVKVDAEEKKPKIKVGDFAYHKNTKVKIAAIHDNGDVVAYTYDNYRLIGRECDFEPYVEPTEQTEAHTDANKKLQEEYMRFMKDCMSGEIYTQSAFIEDYDPSKHEVNPKPRLIPKIMFNTEFWVKYEADLAKEIAVKAVNRLGNPQDVAPYAVDIAKDIVKRLKQII